MRQLKADPKMVADQLGHSVDVSLNAIRMIGMLEDAGVNLKQDIRRAVGDSCISILCQLLK